MADQGGIPQVPGNGLQLYFAQVLHPEGEDMAAGFGGNLFAVGIEGHGILVGIDLHFADGFHPVYDTSNSYLFYHRNTTTNRFDRQSGTADACKFLFYRPAEDGETSSIEIPGYVKVSAVEDGGYYLIVAYNTADSNYYALYPSTGSNYSPVIKVNSTLPQVSATVCAPISYELTITAVGKGSTYLAVGNEIYHVTVSDIIGISSETNGGAGKLRTVNVKGTYDGTRYLVAQITEGSGDSARVSVVIATLNGVDPSVILSYKTSAAVEILITDGIPDLTGGSATGATIISSASASAG